MFVEPKNDIFRGVGDLCEYFGRHVYVKEPKGALRAMAPSPADVATQVLIPLSPQFPDNS